jgi:hypothetical protein
MDTSDDNEQSGVLDEYESIGAFYAAIQRGGGSILLHS